MFYKLYDLRASIAFSHRVCNIRGTEVNVVCVPWVTLNGDIIAHYCQWSMTSICQRVILRLQPITITTLNGPDIDCVCLKQRKQQQIASFLQLHNLLLLFYICTFSNFNLFLHPLLKPSSY